MDFFNTPNSSDLQKSEIELVEQKKHEYHFVGTMRKKEGHTLFSFNKVTREIKPANILKRQVYDYMKRTPAYNDRVNIEKDCIYLSALNKKNCIKHLRRIGFEI